MRTHSGHSCVVLKLQVQEPNKLPNPVIQNQQNPTFKFKKSHPHFQTPNREKKNQILIENPLHIFKIEKLKKTHYRKPRNEQNLEMNIPLSLQEASLLYSGANGQQGQQPSPFNLYGLGFPKAIAKLTSSTCSIISPNSWASINVEVARIEKEQESLAFLGLLFSGLLATSFDLTRCFWVLNFLGFCSCLFFLKIKLDLNLYDFWFYLCFFPFFSLVKIHRLIFLKDDVAFLKC